MFWGLNLKANRKYSQTTNKSFHISQAALDSETSDGGSNEVFITYDNQKFLICTLRKETCEQVMVDFNFAAGDKISFQTKGTGDVTLTGYIVDNFDFMNDMGSESDSEDGNVAEINDLQPQKNKKKRVAAAIAALQVKKEVKDDDEEEEDDDDYIAGEDDDEEEVDENEEVDGFEGEDDDDEEDDDEDEDEDEEEDEDEDVESEDEPEPQPQVKKVKLEKPQKQQNGVSKETVAPAAVVTKKKQKKDKKQDNQNKQQQQQQQQKGERVLSGGVKIEDIRVGNGSEVVNNKRVQVYYEGRLKSNNKVFDSLKAGNGFKFTVGRSEVIKGWDIGLIGMKVGGKRRIVCPPHMGYGPRGSPPAIPPNSTLVFEVELKSVN